MTLQLVVRRHPLIWFAVLSLLLSWWAWPLYGLGLMPLPIASFGPFLAALIVLMVTEGSQDGGAMRYRACNQDARPCTPRSSSAY